MFVIALNVMEITQSYENTFKNLQPQACVPTWIFKTAQTKQLAQSLQVAVPTSLI